MPDHAADLAARLAEQLNENDFPVVVEASDGALVISGTVPTEEARQAVFDLVASAAISIPVEYDLDVESILPPDIDRFASAEASTEPPLSRRQIRAQDEELDPDFTDQPLLRDPIAAAGPNDLDDPVASGDEVYSPPDDPVIGADQHGRVTVVGGFGGAGDVRVERSAMDSAAGDEALADAVRQELSEDASTADLVIVVAVRRGVVHLRGQVEGMEDAENAEAVASRVEGVREVVEELEVLSV